MATLAPPGFYANADLPRLSITINHRGEQFEGALTPLVADDFQREGVLPAQLYAAPGSRSLGGSFGRRRGRRFASTPVI